MEESTEKEVEPMEAVDEAVVKRAAVTPVIGSEKVLQAATTATKG